MAYSPYSSQLTANPNKGKDSKPLDPCNVFVKYLPSDLRDVDLQGLFAPFGTVLSSKIMLDPVSRQSLGFGFVRFGNASEAQAAITRMDGHRLGSKRLLCKLANSAKSKDVVVISEGKASSEESMGPTASSSPRHPSAEFHPGSEMTRSGPVHTRNPSTNLYIKNLSPSDTEDTLRALFGPFGEIETVKIMTCKQTGVSRGVGFVRFRELSHATSAIEAMHGSKYQDQRLVVQYADQEGTAATRKRRTSAATSNSNASQHFPSSLGSSHNISRRTMPLEGRGEYPSRRHSAGSHHLAAPHGTSSSWNAPPPPPPPPGYLTGSTPYAWPPPMYPAAIYDPQFTPQWMIVYNPNAENVGYFSGSPALASGHPLARPAGTGASSSAHASGATSAGSSPTATTATQALPSHLAPFVTPLPPYAYHLPMYYPIDPTSYPIDLPTPFHIPTHIETPHQLSSVSSSLSSTSLSSAAQPPSSLETMHHNPPTDSPLLGASHTSPAALSSSPTHHPTSPFSASISSSNTQRNASAQQVAQSVAVDLQDQIPS